MAAFVSLTVILAVTSYFLYSSYSQTDAKLTQAEKTSVGEGQKAASDALNQYEELRKQIGTRADGNSMPPRPRSPPDARRSTKKSAALTVQINEAIAKAQEAGATSTELEYAKATVQQLANGYLTEPNKTFISSLDRLKDLLGNQAMLTTAPRDELRRRQAGAGVGQQREPEQARRRHRRRQ